MRCQADSHYVAYRKPIAFPAFSTVDSLQRAGANLQGTTVRFLPNAAVSSSGLDAIGSFCLKAAELLIPVW